MAQVEFSIFRPYGKDIFEVGRMDGSALKILATFPTRKEAAIYLKQVEDDYRVEARAARRVTAAEAEAKEAEENVAKFKDLLKAAEKIARGGK